MVPHSSKQVPQTGEYRTQEGERTRATTTTIRSPHHTRKTCFPFTELPPEIRNQIYRYLLTSENPIGIAALPHLQYKRTISTRTVERTTFMNPSEASDEDTPHEYKTTYGLDPIRNQTLPYFDLLRVNRQIRLEGSPVLYGTNTFVFGNSRCLLPFMRDRSLESVGLVRNLVIAMIWPSWHHHPWVRKLYHAGYNYGEWADVLSGLGKCNGLQLKEVYFSIFGPPGDMDTQWIQKRYGRGICNLEKLGLEIRPTPSLDGYLGYESDDAESPAMVHTRVDEKIWNKLAPKLLKKEGLGGTALKARRLPPFRYGTGDRHQNKERRSKICIAYMTPLGELI